MRWSALQPLLMAEGAADLLVLVKAGSPAGGAAAAYCRRLLAEPRDVLDPPPLVTGDDLQALGIPPGPDYGPLLRRIRAAQLDGDVRGRADALAMARKWTVEGETRSEEKGEGSEENIENLERHD